MDYKIKIGFEGSQIETEVEADSWTEAMDYVFGNIEVIERCKDCQREAFNNGRCERCLNGQAFA